MNGSAHAAASAAAKLPAYCSGWAHAITPAQWAQCWKLGWDQPTGTAAHAGYYTGHNIVPVLAAVILAVLALAWLRRGKPAPQPAPRARASAGARR